MRLLQPATMAALAAGVLACSLLPAGPAEASRRSERALQHEGFDCAAVADADGATHECLFVPATVKGRDFSRRNVRAGQVVTVLGPQCGYIEILSDEAETDAGGRTLQRVRVACSD